MACRPPSADAGVRDTIVREYLLAQNTVAESDRKLAALSEQERTLFLGEKTIGRYGCFGCHAIAGFEKATPIGIELTEQGSEAGRAPRLRLRGRPIPHTLPGWLHAQADGPARVRPGQGQEAGRAAAHGQVPLQRRGGRRDRHGHPVLHQGAGAARGAEAALGRRALRAEGRAPGARPELPRLPQARRAGRLDPGGHQGPARAQRAARPSRPARCRRRSSTTRSRRSARARASTRSGCTSS